MYKRQAEMLQENIYLKQLILIGPNQETIREINDDFKDKLVCISIKIGRAHV